MPTSTASVIASVVAGLGLISGALFSSDQNLNSAANLPSETAIAYQSIQSLASHTNSTALALTHDHQHLHAHSEQALGDISHEERRHHRKPGAEVFLLSPNSYHLSAGTPKTIEVEIELPPEVGQLHVQFASESGVELLSETEVTINTGSSKVAHLDLELRANIQGEHPLHVFTTFVDQYGNASARAMATALKVDMLEEFQLQAKHQAEIAAPQEFVQLPSVEVIR